MDFLAFPVQKLWQNKQKLIKEIPNNSQGNSFKNGVFWPYLSHQKFYEVDQGLQRLILQPRIQTTLSHDIGSLSGRWLHKRKNKKKQNIPQP